MARYRIGETPASTELEATDNLFIAAAIFTLFLGIGFIIVGIRAKQYWLASSGLILFSTSVIYLGYLFFY